MEVEDFQDQQGESLGWRVRELMCYFTPGPKTWEPAELMVQFQPIGLTGYLAPGPGRADVSVVA